MQSFNHVPVTGPDGFFGTIDAGRWPLDGADPRVKITVGTGQEMIVPRDLLEHCPDGSYRLTCPVAETDGLPMKPHLRGDEPS